MVIDVRELLVLWGIPGIGPNRLRALINHFKDTRAVLRATARELIAAEGIDRRTALSIVEFFRSPRHRVAHRSAEAQLSRLNKLDGRVITYWDGDYPANLKKIYDPPPFLFIRGCTSEIDNYSVAIVGTRSPSPYGAHLAETFSSGFARMGIPVVSGLARGIDTIAHAAAIKTGGRTVAVIGSGIDVVYPPENRELAERITREGALISEFDMGAKPDAGNFPRRNRLISGITLATLVVETGVNGGAMITATAAIDQNREVFAIPSPVNENRRSGTNLLIKESKAKLTESIPDVLTELAPHLKKLLGQKLQLPDRATPRPEVTLFEQRILDALGDEPFHIDALAGRSCFRTSEALVHLLSLELKGIVKQLPGKMFVKT